MEKLVNLSSFEYDTGRFNYNRDNLISFLERYDLDGIELLNPLTMDKNIIPEEIVKGIHLRYYPAWIDFWKENRSELIRQFGSFENVVSYYGGRKREDIVDYLRKEILCADEMGAEYAVFHISHAQMEHVFNYKFTYSDREVIDASAEFVNGIFKGLDTKIKLLFENLWWPGLTLLDREMAYRLLERVEYKNKGFMLDTGHLMNTNIKLENEKQAIDYVLETVDNLGELGKLIKGLHLNLSISGRYVTDNVINKEYHPQELTISKMNENIYGHISSIDMHSPFTGNDVRKIIERIEPDYLVYEFVTNSLDELERNIMVQDRAVFG